MNRTRAITALQARYEKVKGVFPPYPTGAIKDARELPRNRDFLYLVDIAGNLNKWTYDEFSKASAYVHWNINGRSSQFPDDFAFTNYWFAWAYAQQRKRPHETKAQEKRG